MCTVRLAGIFRIITVLFIVGLLAGCGGGGGGGSDNNGGEEALSVAITSPSGGVNINKGESVEFESTISGGSEPYKYQWDFGGSVTNSNIEDPGSIVFSTVGSYTVNLTVTDNKGATTSKSVVVTVNDPSNNTSPQLVVSIISPSNGTTITAGQSINLLGSITGGTGPYTFQWTINGGNITSSTAQNPGNVIFSTPGTYNVTFQVSDLGNHVSGASVLINVNSPPPTQDTTPPTVTSTSPSNGASLTTAPSALTVTFSENIVFTPAMITVSGLTVEDNRKTCTGNVVTVNLSGKTMTPSSTYSFTFNGIHDAAGNYMPTMVITFSLLQGYEKQDISGVWLGYIGSTFIVGIITTEDNDHFSGRLIGQDHYNQYKQFISPDGSFLTQTPYSDIFTGYLEDCSWNSSGLDYSTLPLQSVYILGTAATKRFFGGAPFGAYSYTSKSETGIFVSYYNTTYDILPNVNNIKGQWEIHDSIIQNNTIELSITPYIADTKGAVISGLDSRGNTFNGTIEIHYSPLDNKPHNLYDVNLRLNNTIDLTGLAAYVLESNTGGIAVPKILAIGATNNDRSYSFSGLAEFIQ